MNRIVTVGLSPFDFLFNGLRFVEEINRRRFVVIGFTHLLRRFLEAHDPRAVLAQINIGNGEDIFAIQAVETLCQVAGDFQMLFLVVADGDEVGLIQEDVRCHEGRIGQQTGRNGVALFRCLVLILSHSFQFTDVGRRNHHPA